MNEETYIPIELKKSPISFRKESKYEWTILMEELESSSIRVEKQDGDNFVYLTNPNLAGSAKLKVHIDLLPPLRSVLQDLENNLVNWRNKNER